MNPSIRMKFAGGRAQGTPSPLSPLHPLSIPFRSLPLPPSAVISRTSEPMLSVRRSPRFGKGATQQESEEIRPKPLVFSSRFDPSVLNETWDMKTGLAVTWLGTSSGSPTLERNVSCTLVRTDQRTYVVDTGEGCARQLMHTKADLTSVNRIFLTHLHGDHCFGLPSLLLLLDLAKHSLSPSDPLFTTHVYGPPGTASMVRATLILTGAHRNLRCPILVSELVTNAREKSASDAMGVLDDRGLVRVVGLMPELVDGNVEYKEAQSRLAYQGMRFGSPETTQSMSDNRLRPGFNNPKWQATHGLYWDIPCDDMQVHAAQLQHRVPCWGFVFREKVHSRQPRKVVIMGDTCDSTGIAPMALNADLIAHEATFARGMERKAEVAQHSTAWMAGQFAGDINARHLVLTHFSSRYSPDFVESSRGRPPLRGGRPGKAPPPKTSGYNSPSDIEDELQQMRTAVRDLISEAESCYLRGCPVSAAVDYLSIHIPPKSSMP